MKLFASLASPYARKVRIVLSEKRMDCELELVDVMQPAHAALAHNPLGKIPVLLLDDGMPLYDSRVIVEFLDNISPIRRLIPKGNRERIAVRRWEALADGVLDAAVLLRLESLRPKSEQSADWMAKQLGKAERGLERMAEELGERNWCHYDRYTLADIALGCCLGWLDFRKPGGLDWLGKHARLARHFAKLSKRAAFVATAPQA
ncbi:MAG: glutathione S-transferase N-terminal domain-containing protein [Burkholderiales bacterium]|nr:glutathione S-transferase N-terminal domain-containing protein [Burkholderiales bacterium]